MFQQLPSNVHEAEEFFLRYQENILARNQAKSLETAETISKTINAGISNILSELLAKQIQLKESEESIIKARKKKKEMMLRIKEASEKNREDVEQKLEEVDEICKELEKECNALSLLHQEKLLTGSDIGVKERIQSMAVAKSLYSNYMQFRLVPGEDKKIMIQLPCKSSNKHLYVAMDKTTKAIIEPQEEVKEFAKELKKNGNLPLMLIKMRKFAQQRK